AAVGRETGDLEHVHPTRTTVERFECVATVARSASGLPPASSGSGVALIPHAFAAIPAVSRARNNGLTNIKSGVGTISASPRAALLKRLRPLAVRGRSPSAIPEVPGGTAIACRRIRSFMMSRLAHYHAPRFPLNRAPESARPGVRNLTRSH